MRLRKRAYHNLGMLWGLCERSLGNVKCEAEGELYNPVIQSAVRTVPYWRATVPRQSVHDCSNLAQSEISDCRTAISAGTVASADLSMHIRASRTLQTRWIVISGYTSISLTGWLRERGALVPTISHSPANVHSFHLCTGRRIAQVYNELSIQKIPSSTDSSRQLLS